MPELTQPERPALEAAEQESGAKMSFFDHLVELRKRIISALLGVGAGIIVGLLVSKRFISFIVTPMQAALRANHLDDKLYYTSPAGYISLVISLGVYLGIVLAMPWILYQIWLFVAPGLYKHERRAAAGFIISSTLLFLCGIAFAYFILLPQVLTFLISINEYFSLILIVLVGLGLIFELPVLIFILSIFGIVTPKFLLKNFRYAMLIITVAAAIITPTPDATTMLIFMAPMIALYFVGVLVSYVVVRKKQARQLAEGGAPST